MPNQRRSVARLAVQDRACPQKFVAPLRNGKPLTPRLSGIRRSTTAQHQAILRVTNKARPRYWNGRAVGPVLPLDVRLASLPINFRKICGGRLASLAPSKKAGRDIDTSSVTGGALNLKREAAREGKRTGGLRAAIKIIAPYTLPRLFRAMTLGSYWPTCFRLFRTSTIRIPMAAGTITSCGF